MVEGTSGGDQWGRGRDKGHRSKVIRCQFGSSECVTGQVYTSCLNFLKWITFFPFSCTQMSSTEDPLLMPNKVFEIDITEDHEPPNTIITEEEGLRNSSQLVPGKLPSNEVILEILVMKIPI